jgi:hypothetical protein
MHIFCLEISSLGAIYVIIQNSAVIVPEAVHLAGTPLKCLDIKGSEFKMSHCTISWTQKVLDDECQCRKE